MNQALFTPKLPQPYNRVNWSGIVGSGLGLTLIETAKAHHGLTIVVTVNPQRAKQIKHECLFYRCDNDHLPILTLPDWETLPYDHFSPHQDIISHRLATLSQLSTLEQGILILPVNTLMQRLCPTDFVHGQSFYLATGHTLNLDDIREKLTQSGYRHVQEVMTHGEYAVRGSLFDIFPMGSNAPFRIDLFDDEVDSIRIFDPETQLSQDKIDKIELLPAKEFPVTDEGIQCFRQNWRERFMGNPNESNIYQNVSKGVMPAGIEYYLPLFFYKTATFFDYLANSALFVYSDQAHDATKRFWQDIKERHEQLRHDNQRPILEPDSLYLSPSTVFQTMKSFGRIVYLSQLSTRQDIQTFPLAEPTDYLVEAKAKAPLAKLKQFLETTSGKVLFAVETPGRREVLLNLLKKNGITPHPVQDWETFLQTAEPVCIIVQPLDEGLTLTDPEIHIITESQLFGKKVQQRRTRQTRQETDQVIKSLVELTVGAPVVHINSGIGRYKGLETLHINGQDTEFLTLEYAENDKLYVPVSSLHLISHYTGADADHAPLHKLGSEKWTKDKEKAAKRARDVAAELLEIYAKREARPGHAFSFEQDDYTLFAESFPFEETPDQQQAIKRVIEDMTAKRVMDRLVCGDVGFGKTEVAMRAAFIAVQNHKQIAVLVPTTLLAQQHYQTFCDRFADWPVNVALLSRFNTSAQTQTALDGISSGHIDIVVGTHKLLQKSVQFKDLGLLIIDEEHRFGVRQKDKIKALRANVDILTLTATPIPRTLNLSLSGLRDLSIIATPPSRRLSIKTFVREKSNALIREAILREIHRGGQVFFLHNQVKTIEKTANELSELMPEANIRVAHGQMRERQLEQIMSDFYHQRFNVLVCTTIIETGIDIPTANTMIIDSADNFGLAQLHQLRGRVGRSHHQAYAYLFTPPKGMLTRDAEKRLDAIATFEDLGSGFMLATHDLEIRGAGELLGDDQSGQIHAVGFNLYMELLDRAVQSIKQGKDISLTDKQQATEVNLHIPALIPEDYMPDVHMRLVMYKRIANADSTEALDELQVEMIDRFGLLPDAAKNLFAVTTLKLQAEKLGIEKIDCSKKGGSFEFNEAPNIDTVKLIKMVQKQPNCYRFDGVNRLKFTRTTETNEKRFELIHNLMEHLSPSSGANA